MFDIKLSINGRKVRPEDFGKELEKTLHSDVKQLVEDTIRHRVENAVRPIHCSKHDEPLQVKITQLGDDNYSVSIDGCCDEFVKEAKRAIEMQS